MKNPNWSEEELILALELYLEFPEAKGRSDHPQVRQLSEELQHLTIHPHRVRAAKFRNPNGVGLKLSNFASIDPNGGGGTPHGNRQEQVVWNKYAHDEKTLHQRAAKIREKFTSQSKALSEKTAAAHSKIENIRQLLNELESML